MNSPGLNSEPRDLEEWLRFPLIPQTLECIDRPAMKYSNMFHEFSYSIAWISLFISSKSICWTLNLTLLYTEWTLNHQMPIQVRLVPSFSPLPWLWLGRCASPKEEHPHRALHAWVISVMWTETPRLRTTDLGALRVADLEVDPWFLCAIILL